MREDRPCYAAEPDEGGIPMGISFEGFFSHIIKFNLLLTEKEFDEIWEVLGRIINRHCKTVREKK